MKLSGLTLEYVKDYLNIDSPIYNERIQGHIDSAINYVMLSHGYASVEDAPDLCTDLALIMIQDLFDNGDITTQGAIKFLSIDRRF